MYEKLRTGKEVTIVTNTGESLQGRVKCRFGIGTNENFSPKTEKILTKSQVFHLIIC